jgi:rhamnose utilization protein RhaD (predicted bifunctional aldolase and dehydrogenase)
VEDFLGFDSIDEMREIGDEAQNKYQRFINVYEKSKTFIKNNDLDITPERLTKSVIEEQGKEELAELTPVERGKKKLAESNLAYMRNKAF